MFIGHYAPAAALKPLTPNAPLWHFFVAVQFLDFLWAGFIIAGIEKARVVPGFLEASDLDLYFMPYSHSLFSAVLWSLAGAAAYRVVINPAAGRLGATLIGAAIFSHWVADLIVHAKDLPLFPGSQMKFGLGLWSSMLISKGVEIGLFLGGFILYLGGTAPKGAIGRLSPAVVILALLGIEYYAAVAAAPETIRTVAGLALASYTLIAALAFWLDQTRTARRR